MARVECSIDHVELEGDYTDRNGDPIMVDGVRLTCDECGHQTESFGTGPGSIKRCLVLMREECPEGDNNFYVEG